MVRRLAMRAFAASIAVAALAPWLSPATARAEPVLVYPGMEIHQGNRLCTLGYVDPAQKVAFTAGHCRAGEGAVTDKDHNVIGHLAAFRDNTPSGTTVTTDQSIIDYEAIVLDKDVTVNNVLPGGRQLVSTPNAGRRAGAAGLPFRRDHR